MGIFTNRQPTQLPDPRIVELTQLVKEAAAAVTILEKEIEIRDERIKEYDLMIDKIADRKAKFEAKAQEALDLSEQLISENAELEATIASLKKELEEKNKLIDKQDQEYIDLCNERTSFPAFIQDLFTQAGENSDLEDLLEHAHTLYVELEEELEKKNQEIASWEKAWDDEDEEHAKITEEIEKEHQEEIARLQEEIKYKDQRIWEFTQWHLKDVEYIRKLQAIVDPSGEKFRRYKN